MTHSEMDGLYELYVMGVLESEQAAEISDHLRRQCGECAEAVREASELVASMATMAEPARPSPQLRGRVLTLAGGSSQLRRGRRALAFYLACAAAVGLLFWGAAQRWNLETTLRQLREVSRQRNELRALVAILSEADTRTVNFGARQSDAHGRVFVSDAGGVVFVGSGLPQLETGRTFELWLVPTKGNPQAAGLFNTNAQGVAVNVLAQALRPGEFQAVAVSVEPAGGSPQPSSKPILVVPLG